MILIQGVAVMRRAKGGEGKGISSLVRIVKKLGEGFGRRQVVESLTDVTPFFIPDFLKEKEIYTKDDLKKAIAFIRSLASDLPLEQYEQRNIEPAEIIKQLRNIYLDKLGATAASANKIDDFNGIAKKITSQIDKAQEIISITKSEMQFLNETLEKFNTKRKQEELLRDQMSAQRTGVYDDIKKRLSTINNEIRELSSQMWEKDVLPYAKIENQKLRENFKKNGFPLFPHDDWQSKKPTIVETEIVTNPRTLGEEELQETRELPSLSDCYGEQLGQIETAFQKAYDERSEVWRNYEKEKEELINISVRLFQKDYEELDIDGMKEAKKVLEEAAAVLVRQLAPPATPTQTKPGGPRSSGSDTE